MKNIGYCRDMPDDSLSDLRADLHAAGADKIYSDSAPLGSARQSWPLALAALEQGDRLIVPALYHLGRSQNEFFASVRSLAEIGVQLRLLSDGSVEPERSEIFCKHVGDVDSTLKMIASLQTRAGLEAAHKAGIPHGRPKKVTPEVFERIKLEAARHNIDLIPAAARLGFASKGQIDAIMAMAKADHTESVKVALGRPQTVRFTLPDGSKREIPQRYGNLGGTERMPSAEMAKQLRAARDRAAAADERVFATQVTIKVPPPVVSEDSAGKRTKTPWALKKSKRLELFPFEENSSPAKEQG
jgi:DNA invertase Pin-like site-specific DNA recombinase